MNVINPGAKPDIAEATIKITAVEGGYILRDGKRVAVCHERSAVARQLAEWLEEVWDPHTLGTSGGADADHEPG
tara:strand:- start:1488 stop:1709 length:222 start_codon:yes stop_codon:yes gene_type:complete